MQFIAEWGLVVVLILAVSYPVYRLGVREARCRITAARRKAERANALRAAKTHAEMTDDTVRK